MGARRRERSPRIGGLDVEESGGVLRLRRESSVLPWALRATPALMVLGFFLEEPRLMLLILIIVVGSLLESQEISLDRGRRILERRLGARGPILRREALSRFGRVAVSPEMTSSGGLFARDSVLVHTVSIEVGGRTFSLDRLEDPDEARALAERVSGFLDLEIVDGSLVTLDRSSDLDRAVAGLEGRSSDELRSLTVGDDSTLRVAAIRALEARGEPSPDHVGWLVEVLATTGDGRVMNLAVDVLAGMGSRAAEAVPALVRDLRDRGRHDPGRAARALARIGEVEELLSRALDPEEALHVRRGCLRALGEMGGAATEATARMGPLLDEPTLREATLAVLGSAGTDDPWVLARLLDLASESRAGSSAGEVLERLVPRGCSVVLDASMEEVCRRVSGQLRVSWLRRPEPLRFESVWIRRIPEAEVEAFAIQVANDPDDARRTANQRARCTITPDATLGENGRRVLERTFDEVVLPPGS